MLVDGREEELDIFLDLSGIETATQRASRTSALSNETLLYYYDRLHSLAVQSSPWILVLEEEIDRRGLRPIS
jgi:hypothetical protein